MARDPRVDPTDPPPPSAADQAVVRRIDALGERLARLEVLTGFGASSRGGAPVARARAVALPPPSPSIVDMPPMREKLATLNDSERATVRGVARQVADDFERNVADKSTPAPNGQAVEAMVEARVELLKAQDKAAQWDKLVGERIVAENDRLAAAKAAETLRLELLAQNARERVRVKWLAIGGAVSVALLVAQQLAPRLTGGPPIHAPPGAATVESDGGARVH